MNYYLFILYGRVYNTVSIFYNDVYPIQGLITSGGRERQCKSHILSVYMEMITVDTRLEQINIVVIGEESSFESITQSSVTNKGTKTILDSIEP